MHRDAGDGYGGSALVGKRFSNTAWGGGALFPGCAVDISLEGQVVMGSCWILFD